MKKKSLHLEKTWVLLPVCFLLSLVFLLFASPYTTPLNNGYGYDSAVFMTIGKGMAEGKRLYLDLYDNKGPMIFCLNAVGYFLGGRTGVFALQVVFMTFVFAEIYRLACLFTEQRRAWIAWVVFAFLYCGTVGEGNMTEEWSLGFSLLPMLLALKYLKGGKPVKDHPLLYSAVYGVCLGVQLMFRVTNAAMLAGLILAFTVLLIREKAWDRLFANAAVVLAGAALVIVPFCVHYYRNGAWDYFIYASLLHNFTYAAGGVEAKTAQDWLYWAFRCSAVPLFLVFSVRSVKKGRLSADTALAAACMGLVGMAAVSLGFSYKHYFLLLAPVILLIWAVMDGALYRAGKERKKAALLACILFLTCVAPYTAQSAVHAGKSILFNFRGYNDSRVESMQEIDSRITHDRDSVWGWDTRANIYLYLDVVPHFRHFMTQTWMAESSPFVMAEVEEMMANDPPVWIVSKQDEDCVGRLAGWGYRMVYATSAGDHLALYARDTEE